MMTLTKTKTPIHTFVFNGQDNGGESLSFTATLKNDAFTQSFDMQSYCNSAHIRLVGSLVTPKMLREAANVLDAKWVEVNIRARQTALPTDTLLDSVCVNLVEAEDSEPLILRTEYFDNGDSAAGLESGVYTNQHLVSDNGNIISSFHLCGASITPEGLRKLANELDHFLAVNNTIKT